METTNTIQNPLLPDDEISLKEIILKLREWYRYLLSKWIVIFLAGIVGGTLGLTYAWFKKPVYTAACNFVLEEGNAGSGMGQYAGIASMVGIDLGGSGGGGIFQGDNIIELYKSRTMIEKTLLSPLEINGKKQLLIDRYIDFNNLRETWSHKAEFKNIQFKGRETFSRLQDSIVSSIVNDINKNHLNVSKPDKKLSIIKVEVQAKDEAFAKAFNDQIVKNVNDFYIQTKTKKTLDNIYILTQKTDSVRSVMNGAVYTSVAISDATPNLNPTRQVQRAVPMQRAQISVETNKAMLGELIKNLELSRMALRQETPLIQVIDRPVFPLKKEQLSHLKAIVIGSTVVGILTIFLLLVRRILQGIMA
ncbi:MAG TPA: hypothetical protein VNI52_06005 [Sphingobacteriaceae bacterium]|nr:hypothetical protein [Sphingobacteriaceae bacterium]